MLNLNKDTGTVLWSVPIIGTAPGENQGRAIAADPTNDAVIAVGVTQNNRSSFDITVAHFMKGQEDWRQVITGPGKRVGRDDAVLAIAVDPRRGSFALAGYTQNTGTGVSGTQHEFTVVKARQDGTVAWKYDFSDPAPHSGDRALATAVDATGDVFAAGRTCYFESTSCFTVVRIGPRGQEVWRTIIRGTVAGRDEARAIIQDPLDGNIIAAGQVQTPAGVGFAVFKLDANSGAILWSPAVGGPLGTAYALTLTSRGTVAVGGQAQGGFAVLEFDTRSGTLVSSGILGAGEARSVAFDDDDGTVVAGGTTRSPPASEMSVAKFDWNGTMVWSANVGKRSSTSAGAAVAIDPVTGSVGVGGALEDPQGRALFAVALLRRDGTEQWLAAIPGWVVQLVSGLVAVN